MPENNTIVVSGGAGYIGSCTAHLLKNQGWKPVILDNFSTSTRTQTSFAPLYEVELTDRKATEEVFKRIGPVHAIFHFAAKALVPESVQKPWTYFHNNLGATLTLAECAVKFNVPHFIHSSSCAVYGLPTQVPILETAPLTPVTPYGESKATCERLLDQFTRWKNFRVLNLRYFNPAGAIPEAGLGERHEPETHLIPNLVRTFEKQSPFEIFGNQYPTPDGSCIRDFIHIRDLSEAHLKALQYLETHPEVRFDTINIGSGRGTSVKEAVHTAEKIFGKNLPIKIMENRPGDPPQLVADTTKMRKLFKWEPLLPLEQMIKDEVEWRRIAP